MDNTYPVVITVDETTYNFTQDSLKELIKEHKAQKDVIAANRNESSEQYRKIVNLRNEVYGFFKEAYDSEDPWVVENKEEINWLLDNIGADKLKTLFNAEVTITLTITDIEADDAGDVEYLIRDNLLVECGEFSTDVIDVSYDEIEEQ